MNGQVAFVAEKGDVFTNDQGRRDARLRVIFENVTESNMLMRSLQRQLNADPAGRRITEPDERCRYDLESARIVEGP